MKFVGPLTSGIAGRHCSLEGIITDFETKKRKEEKRGEKEGKKGAKKWAVSAER